jgi:hypothetical protein
LLANPDALPEYLKDLTVLLGEPKNGIFSITSPQGTSINVIVRIPRDEREHSWVADRGEGLYAIAIGTRGKTSQLMELVGSNVRLLGKEDMEL